MSTAKAKPRLIKNIFYVFNTKLLILVLGLLGTIAVSRALGAEGRGLVAALLIYPQLLVSVFEGGMRQASIYYLGKRLADESQIIGSILLYTVMSSILGYFVALYLMTHMEGEHFPALLMWLAAVLLPISLCVSGLRGYFLGTENISSFNKVAWVEKLIYIIAVLLLYATGHLTVANVLYVTVLSAFFNLLIGIIYFAKSGPARPTFKFTLLMKMMRSGVVYAVAFFLITANYQLDILLLSWLSETSELGIYTLTVKLGELLWQLPAAIVVVLISKGANTKAEEMVQIICKTCRLTLLITVCSAFCLWVGCYFLVIPVFGADFAAVSVMVTYLLPGIVLATLFKSLNSHYAGQGKPLYAVYIMGVAVLVNLLLNVYLIPRFGGNGAAIASSVSYGVSAILIVGTFCRMEKVAIKDVLLIKVSDLKPLKNLLWKNRCARLS